MERLTDERDARLSRGRRVIAAAGTAGTAGVSPVLPQALTSFVGRERELAEVRRLMERARLVTLTGPGGIGKTRLALRVAAAAARAFEDGAWFVDLAPLRDAALVLPTVAQALGVRRKGGRPARDTLADTLVDALQDRHALLVFDNFERVIEAAPDVSALLRACPRLVVLVTSRVALSVYGEHQFPVPSLAVSAAVSPTNGEARTHDPNPPYQAAVCLFVDRARAVRPDFTLDEQNTASVTELCRRLDGVPLAIELAAARTSLFPPQALVARLSRMLPVLTGGPRDAPARHQTLRATLDWSHDLLSPAEQVLLRRLAVFTGGGTLTAAEAICGDHGQPDGAGPPGIAVADGVASLLAKSLLHRGEAAGQPRLGMLQSVREYAGERLQASGEANEVSHRHAAYYVALATGRTVSPLANRTVRTGLDELEAELGNYRSALAWLLAQSDGEASLRLALTLYPVWEEEGRLAEGAHWLQRALAADRQGPDLLRAEGMRLLALLLRYQGDHTRAHALQEQCLRIYRARGDHAHVAAVLMAMGSGARNNVDFATARECFEESLPILTELGHTAEVARCLAWLATVARGERRAAAARAYLERSMALNAEIARKEGELASADGGAVSGEVAPFRCIDLDLWCLWNLGALACDEGDFASAAGYLRDQLRLNPAWDPYSLAATLLQVARVAVLAARPYQAAQLLAAADAQRARSGVCWPQVDQMDRDQVLAAFGAPQPAAALQRDAAEGAAMSLEEALALGLQTLETLATDPNPAPLHQVPRSGEAMSPPGSHLTQPDITRREREVAALVARGLSNRQIAAVLTITERTAENHVEHILTKLGFRSRAQVAAWATERGLTRAS